MTIKSEFGIYSFSKLFLLFLVVACLFRIALLLFDTKKRQNIVVNYNQLKKDYPGFKMMVKDGITSLTSFEKTALSEIRKCKRTG